MSDKREVQNKVFILTTAEDYPRWKSHTLNKLAQSNCSWALDGRDSPTLEFVKEKLIGLGFTQDQLRPSILVFALLNKGEKHETAMAKSKSIIHKLVVDANHPILEGKTTQEMWNALKIWLQHISPMGVSRILHTASAKKMSDFKDVVKYTSSYQAAFDKITSLLKEDSNLTMKSAEMLLQGAMLMNISEEYTSLISTIETGWTDATTNLSNTILQIIRHSEIMKGHAKEKVLLTSGIHRAPKGSCTNPECVEKGLTTHYTDRCWIKHPELRAKYTLRQMRPKGSSKNLKAKDKDSDEPRASEGPPAERES